MVRAWQVGIYEDITRANKSWYNFGFEIQRLKKFRAKSEKESRKMGAREKMAAVHRALAFYNLNEGIDNHVTCLARSQLCS